MKGVYVGPTKDGKSEVLIQRFLHHRSVKFCDKFVYVRVSMIYPMTVVPCRYGNPVPLDEWEQERRGKYLTMSPGTNACLKFDPSV